MITVSTPSSQDPVRPWYQAIGSMGDCITFRFGHLAPGAKEPRWFDISHVDFDGIGGFAHLLRKGGAALAELPDTAPPCPPSWGPMIRALPRHLGPRQRLDWRDLERGAKPQGTALPEPVLAWHLFGEEETEAVRAVARRAGVTINTYLLKGLDEVLRPDLRDPEARVPWMVPVNLRGQIKQPRDTENHSSYVAVRIAPTASPGDVQHDLRCRLERGEHWAAWKGFLATKRLPMALRRLALRHERVLPQWSLGVFTNLGVWDPEKRIATEALRGSWLLAGPVIRCQQVAGACLTFQGRLALTIRVHPDLTTAPAVPTRWMDAWVARLRSEIPARSLAQGAVV